MALSIGVHRDVQSQHAEHVVFKLQNVTLTAQPWCRHISLILADGILGRHLFLCLLCSGFGCGFLRFPTRSFQQDRATKGERTMIITRKLIFSQATGSDPVRHDACYTVLRSLYYRTEGPEGHYYVIRGTLPFMVMMSIPKGATSTSFYC